MKTIHLASRPYPPLLLSHQPPRERPFALLAIFPLGKTIHQRIYVSRRQSMAAFQYRSYSSAAAYSRGVSACWCPGQSVEVGGMGRLLVANALLSSQQRQVVAHKRNKPSAFVYNREHTLLSCGLSFRRVLEPTRIPSCIVRILARRGACILANGKLPQMTHQ